MKKILHTIFLMTFAAVNFSCGNLSVGKTGTGVGGTDDSLDAADIEFAKGSSGYYESVSGDYDPIKIGQDGSFSKVEYYKAGFGQGVFCKFDLKGVFSAIKRDENNRKKFWYGATHIFTFKVNKVTLLNGQELNFVDQKSCADLQSRSLVAGVLEIRYYIGLASINTLRFFNMAQDELTGGEQAPEGVLFRKFGDYSL